MAAIRKQDETIVVPVSVNAPGLHGDGVVVLCPDDIGYDEAASAAVAADQHPLTRAHDRIRSAWLEEMFGAREHHATA